MIKYLVMDVDGTLTDGKIYMGPNGEAMKGFSVKDGYVINYLLKPQNIIPVILTARSSSIVQNRCSELGITEIYQGKLDKLTTLKDIVGNDGLGACAYFGDDILDLKCMLPIKKAGGIVGCPSDAVREVKAVSDYVCINKAGEGALREFSEWLVSEKIDSSVIIERINAAVEYLMGLNITENDIGKHIVDNNFFYYVQKYETRPTNECKLESHREYIDIQIVVKGYEAIDLVDICRLTVKEEYDAEKDVIYWNVPPMMSRTTLTEGDCIVLYPENAHRGAVCTKESNIVLKIVGKVKIR